MTWPQVGAIVVALEFVILALGGFGIDVFEVGVFISRGTLGRGAIGTALSSSSATIVHSGNASRSPETMIASAAWSASVTTDRSGF